VADSCGKTKTTNLRLPVGQWVTQSTEYFNGYEGGWWECGGDDHASYTAIHTSGIIQQLWEYCASWDWSSGLSCDGKVHCCTKCTLPEIDSYFDGGNHEFGQITLWNIVTRTWECP
jgi:hypothetical protein